MPEVRPLGEVAEEFAARLADTVSRFLGRECNFTSTATPSGRFTVADEGDGIPLHIRGVPLLVLSVDIRCHWDSRETYLAVGSHSSRCSRAANRANHCFGTSSCVIRAM